MIETVLFGGVIFTLLSATYLLGAFHEEIPYLPDGKDDGVSEDVPVDREAVEAHFQDLDEEDLREEAVDLAQGKKMLASANRQLEEENERLRDRIEDLDSQVQEVEAENEELEEMFDSEGAIDLEPPHMQTSTFGLLEDLWREWRHRKQEKKLARKGYVKWHLVNGNTLSRPKYVQPEATGGGLPTYEYEGHEYLFHRDSMVATESNGMWTVIHKKGEADPINVRDPLKEGIPCDALDEYLTLEVASESPDDGFLGFDMDRQKAIRYALGGTIVIVAMQKAMENGVI